MPELSKPDLSKPPALNGNKNDPRVSYSQVSQKWIYEDEETGLEYEYDESLKNWVPVLTEEAILLQQKAYERKSEEKEKNNKEGQEEKDSKRKESQGDATKRQNKRQKRSDHPAAASTIEKKTTGIYISNLPLDITREELEETFSKYGVIAEDFDTAEKRIKVYVDEETQKPKGDALVIYFKPESVDLAIQMMDGVPIRFEKDAQKISVKKAEFKKSDTNGAEGDDAAANDQNQNPKKTIDAQTKLKIQRQMQKLTSKIADWDDEVVDEDIPKRWQKTMLLKHAFSPEELHDVTAAMDIKEDILQGCEEIGPVTSVNLYDLEPEGIVLVKFKKRAYVQQAIDLMDGRYFGGRKLEASTYDGKIKYMRTKKNEEDEEQEDKRLEEFGEWLSKEGEGE